MRRNKSLIALHSLAQKNIQRVINRNKMKTLMESKTFFATKYFAKKIFLVAALISFLFACTKHVEQGTTTVDCSVAKSFNADIKPITQNSCSMDSDCHGAGSTSGPGELLTYTEIFNAHAAIRSAVASGVMPKDATLSASDKNAILCWIDNGATNN